MDHAVASPRRVRVDSRFDFGARDVYAASVRTREYWILSRKLATSYLMSSAHEFSVNVASTMSGQSSSVDPTRLLPPLCRSLPSLKVVLKR